MKTALLLAGGLATRLGELSRSTPKACVPIDGLSPLAFLIPRLAAAGVHRIWINLHHHSEQVQHEAERVCPPGIELCWFFEDALLGTGGTLLGVTHKNGEIPDLVANAKMFTDFDWVKILKANAPTLVLHPSSDLEVFGGFRYSETDQIESLRRAGAPRQEAKVGVYTGICRPSESWLPHLKRAPTNAPICLIRHGLLATVHEQPVNALIHHGAWCEISTPDRIDSARETLRGILSREDKCADATHGD